MTFEPSNTLLEGIEDIIRLLTGWKIDETAEGVIGIGSINDARFDQPSTYHFERDKNCWSYSANIAMSRHIPAFACIVKSRKHAVRRFTATQVLMMPEHRTLFVNVPDGTSYAELQEYAETLLTVLSPLDAQKPSRDASPRRWSLATP